MNLFFLKELSELEREERTPEMEEQDFCALWSDDDPPECLEWIKIMVKKKDEIEEVEYEAYVFNVTRKESFPFCTEWTYNGTDDEGNPIQLVEPQCVAYEVRNHDVPYTLELDAVKVGQVDDKDIIHLLPVDPWLGIALKTDPDYIGDSYSGMDEEIRDEAMETVYEIDEEDPETHEMVKVHKRKKTKKWEDDGQPGVLKSVRIPHKFAGVNTE